MTNIDKYFEKNLDKESYNSLMELRKNWRYSWGDIEEKVDIEDNKIVWKGNLNIMGTNIKKIKAKRIEGYVNANSLESLEEIEVEEILGNLDLRGTNIAFQLKVIEKIRSGELKLKLEILFGGYIEGIERLCEDKNLEIPGYLYIRGTKVEKIKVKSIKGGINVYGVEALKKIEVEEEIIGNLDIRGTKVNKIKAKQIKGSVFANSLETLKKIEVEEIGGDLDIEGTDTDFQLGIIEKVRNGKLKVKGKIIFGGEYFKSL